MKKLFLIILFSAAFLNTLQSQPYWIRSTLSPALELNKLVYTDSTNFYIAADSGKIFHSSNAGVSWGMVSTGFKSDILDICFLDPNTGFATTWEFGFNDAKFSGSIILKTTNAGLNWNTYRIDTNIFMGKILFTDNLNGYLTGDSYGILRTTNGGNNWFKTHIDSNNVSNYTVRNFKRYNSHLTIACGGLQDIRGVIWKSTDDGYNWVAQGVTPEPLYDIHFYDENNIIAVGGDFEFGGSMARTTNGGRDWEYIPFDQFGIAEAMAFRTSSEGWAVMSIGQKFMYTFDSGQHWNPYDAPNGEILSDVKFSNKRNGIAIGQDGAILKYNTDYVSIANNNSSVPSTIELKQNYPNPFNPETVISYSLQKQEYVSLKIFDVLGKEVKILVNEIKTPGEHKIKFHADDFPAGVYYYTLKTGNNFGETKKMVLVK